jgi:hypothetical protein
MTYDLSNLVSWARRTGADTLTRTRDTLITDGTTDVTMSSTGNIEIVSVRVGGVTQDPSTYDVEVSTIVFNDAPASGLNVIVLYDTSTYTDAQVLEYVSDSLHYVVSKLALFGWQFNTTDPLHPLANDPHDHDIPQTNVMQQALEALIALGAGIQIRKDMAGTAGRDAILIKDGDTTIDTSKTANASEKVLKRMQAEYDNLMNVTIANRTRGKAIQNNWVPLPYPWSTPNMMPGEVNGPTY